MLCINKKLKWSRFESKYVIISVIAVGIILRLLLSLLGNNFDLDSYRIVAKIVDQGGNVYRDTARYNYGPIWSYVVFIIYRISLFLPNSYFMFRFLISAFLTLVDLGIFLILYNKYSEMAAILFFCNPISIIITGYHSQFDNFALLIGLFAISLFSDNLDKKLDLRSIIGIILIGVSITTKHILFLFPLWIAAKTKNRINKCIIVFLPVIIFLGSFIPFWNNGHTGIIENVLMYRSINNAPCYNLLLPDIFKFFVTPVSFFLIMLLLGAFIFYKQDLQNSILLYTAMLVIFSSAIANQYLVIPVAFISLYFNGFFLLYTILTTWFLLIDIDGLNIAIIQKITPWFISRDLLIVVLFIGLLWAFYKKQIVDMCKIVYNKMNKFDVF